MGQFLGLVPMLLQLVTAGGTFPWQTIPEPLRALHHLLPMPCAVQGLRQLLSGGSVSGAWRDAGILLLGLIAALGLSARTSPASPAAGAGHAHRARRRPAESRA